MIIREQTRGRLDMGGPSTSPRAIADARGVQHQQMIDQPLCVGALDEEAGGAGVLDRMNGLASSLHDRPKI
jgi:hypothetical protein